MAKASQNDILSLIDTQIAEIGKSLDFKPISLNRGSYVGGSISFGSYPINLITGGGAPPGRWTTVYGPEASGKSTIAFAVIADALAKKVPVLYYDHESAADPMYMKTMGIDLHSPYFYYFQPETGQSTYRHLNRLLRQMPAFTASQDGDRPYPACLAVIDSLDAMLSEDMAENDENAQMGLQAKMHTNGMRLIKSILGTRNVSVFATNQTRLKPGVSFGNPEYEPGGQAVKFYPDLKYRVQSVGKVFKERGRDCKFVNVTTYKNKGFSPFRHVKEETNTAPALAFGLGFERGYDGYAYMKLTNQIEGKGSYEVSLAPFSGKYKWDDLMKLCCSKEFREVVQSQFTNGTAFTKYFAHEQIDPTINLEDAGTDGLAAGVAEDAEAVEEGLPKKRRSKASNDIEDGPIKMRNMRVTDDGEVVELERA